MIKYYRCEIISCLEYVFAMLYPTLNKIIIILLNYYTVIQVIISYKYLIGCSEYCDSLHSLKFVAYE